MENEETKTPNPIPSPYTETEKVEAEKLEQIRIDNLNKEFIALSKALIGLSIKILGQSVNFSRVSVFDVELGNDKVANFEVTVLKVTDARDKVKK